MNPSATPTVTQKRLYAHFVAHSVLVFALLLSFEAHAQTMVGLSLLTFAANNIIAPLGIFSVVLALGGSFFRPDLVKGAIYSALICAVLFFIIKSAPQLTTALKS
jgi:hypothetical protein